MSRIGLLPIQIPSEVEVLIVGLSIVVKGKYGELKKTFKGSIKIINEDSKVLVSCVSKDKHSRSIWGTARSIIFNMVKGVSSGFTKDIDLIGVGYKVSVQGNYINLSLGKSHNTKMLIPSDINVSVKGNRLTLFSKDKDYLGRFTSKIISQRPPEPFKGKGIREVGQYVQIKEVKKG